MRRAKVYVHNHLAGYLEEVERGKKYRFKYLDTYHGSPVSLTMPTEKRTIEFEHFPPFFDGLLPEGIQLEGLLKSAKLDRTDYFGQLLVVGNDMVGAVTVKKVK